MAKKILWTILALIIVGVIVLAIWFFFFKNNTEQSNLGNEDPRRFFPTENQDSLQGRNEVPDGTNLNGENTNEEDRFAIPTLRQLSSEPVSGMVSFERLGTSSETILNEFDEEILATTSETIFRYVERGTGHLYETKDSSLTKVRLSHITIPRIYSAQFDTTGDKVLLRFLDKTLSATETFRSMLVENELADEENGSRFALEGQFMPQNILMARISPDGDQIAYLIKNATSTETSSNITGSSLVITSFENNQSSVVYQSPLSEWIIDWPTDNIISFETKPHSDTTGFLYHLNLNTGSFTKIIEGFRGLTSLTNANADRVLFSGSPSNQMNLYIGNIEEDTYEDLGLATLPEKCVWSRRDVYVAYCASPALVPRLPYPESWYRGEVAFTDNIWRIDVEENTQDIIFSINDSEEFFDMTNLQLSEQDEYLLFINKNDLTLWSLDIRS